MRHGTFVGMLLCAVVLAGGCVTDGTKSKVCEKAASGGATVTGFLNKTMVVDGHERGYVVYVPRNYNPAQPWPLIVFLNGAGARGDDGLTQTEVGLGRAIRLWPDRFPCLVVMPQAPKGALWHEIPNHIDTALAQTRNEYNVDADRISLTGASVGGYGAWMYGAERVDTFAAIMPLCGGGRPEDASALARVPIWAAHGALDKVIPPEKSREMVEAVQAAGGNVQYVEFSDKEHNVWDSVYGNPKAIQWLLAQKRSARNVGH